MCGNSTEQWRLGIIMSKSLSCRLHAVLRGLGSGVRCLSEISVKHLLGSWPTGHNFHAPVMKSLIPGNIRAGQPLKANGSGSVTVR